MFLFILWGFQACSSVFRVSLSSHAQTWAITKDYFSSMLVYLDVRTMGYITGQQILIVDHKKCDVSYFDCLTRALMPLRSGMTFQMMSVLPNVSVVPKYAMPLDI